MAGSASKLGNSGGTAKNNSYLPDGGARSSLDGSGDTRTVSGASEKNAPAKIVKAGSDRSSRHDKGDCGKMKKPGGPGY
jgi:hypothetical protein